MPNCQMFFLLLTGALSLCYHTVEPGETLISIAKRYSTTVKILCDLNRFANPSSIIVGEEIIVPCWGTESIARPLSDRNRGKKSSFYTSGHIHPRDGDDRFDMADFKHKKGGRKVSNRIRIKF